MCPTLISCFNRKQVNTGKKIWAFLVIYEVFKSCGAAGLPISVCAQFVFWECIVS